MATKIKAKVEEKARRKVGFKDDGSPYPGVDPETGERKVISLAVLRSEFGPKTGEEKYKSIVLATGAFDLFGRPLEAYSPDIGLDGVDGGTIDKVNEILAKE